MATMTWHSSLLGLLLILYLHATLSEAGKGQGDEKLRWEKSNLPAWIKNKPPRGSLEASRGDHRKASININKIKKILAKKIGKSLAPNLPVDNTLGRLALTGDQAEKIYQRLQSKTSQHRRKRKVIDFNIPTFKRWTFPVYFLILPEFSPSEVWMIFDAWNMWMAKVGISFLQTTNPPPGHTLLVFFKSNRCLSHLGETGDFAQLLELSTACLDWPGSVAQMIGLTLGLIPEHNRVDRDSFVNIPWGNIKADKLSEFMVFMASYLHPIVKMDCGSIMMYSSREHSQTGGLTIQTKDPLYQKCLGQPVEVSFFDAMAFDIAYNTPPAPPGSIAPNNWFCGNGGYRIPPNLSCKCPDGFRGTYCTAPDPGLLFAAVTPVGSPITVLNTNWVATATIKTNNWPMPSYQFGQHAYWHLVPAPWMKIEVKFEAVFGLLCENMVETCIHWVEVQTSPGIKRGYRFCCTGPPLPGTITGPVGGTVLVLFNTRQTTFPSTMDSTNPYYRYGFKLSYRSIM